MSEVSQTNTSKIEATLERIEYELRGLVILHTMIVDALHMLAYRGVTTTGEQITKQVHDLHQEILEIIRQSEQPRR